MLQLLKLILIYFHLFPISFTSVKSSKIDEIELTEPLLPPPQEPSKILAKEKQRPFLIRLSDLLLGPRLDVKVCDTCNRIISFQDNNQPKYQDVHPFSCPKCNQSLIQSPSDLLNCIVSIKSCDFNTWHLILNHIKFFNETGRSSRELRNLDWSEAYRQILINSDSGQLGRFLDLNFVDVNVDFRDETCALTALIRELYYQRNFQFKIGPLLDNLQVLLSHPKIVLNRRIRQDDSYIHIIQETIEFDSFDLFLIILEASPNLNLNEIFKCVCRKRNRQRFFDHFLNLKSLDVFQLDHFGLSLFNYVFLSQNENYISAMLSSPKLK